MCKHHFYNVRWCIANHFLCSCVCDMDHKSAIKYHYYYYYNIQGSHAVLKVLNFKIGFQDLEKVLNLAKMSLRYWKSIEIPNGKDKSVKQYFSSYLKLDVLKITTVIVTSSIIFLSWFQELQIVSFFHEEVSIWVYWRKHWTIACQKVEALGHWLKPAVEQVVSGTPQQFHNILSWFKVEGRIIG